MVSSFDIAPLNATFGAIIRGVKVAMLDDSTFSDLYATWLKYALLVFPDQHLSRDEQIAFAKRFGNLEFEFAPISNVKADGTLIKETDHSDVAKILQGNMAWHCDSTYMAVQAKGAVFSAVTVPTAGGETEWADMRAAYELLSDAMRTKVEGLAAYHSLRYSQGKIGHVPKEGSDYSGYGFHNGPVPLRPLVKVHPETGCKSLVIGRHAHGIPYMNSDDSERLLQELVDFACHPPRV
jgi:alpha-ketoglutarate-dependent taurine dioxygenase